MPSTAGMESFGNLAMANGMMRTSGEIFSLSTLALVAASEFEIMEQNGDTGTGELVRDRARTSDSQ